MPDAQHLAERVCDTILGADAVARELGITVTAVQPGAARVAMTVTPRMLNGAGLCHGGIITTLADAAFAFACNSRDLLTVAAGLNIEFLAPAHLGDALVAEAREVWLRGRSGLYDVVVQRADGTVIAHMRGRSHQLQGRRVLPADGTGTGSP